MKTLDEMLALGQPLVVIYHSLCMDGFTAVYVAQRRLGKDTILLPHAYGSAISGLPKGRCSIFMLDVSFSREMMDQVAKEHDLVVLDHHKSAAANLAGADYAHFDMAKSGAGLAWDYFVGHCGPVSQLVQYVQDRDLWNWALQNSQEVNAVIGSYAKTLDTWAALSDALEYNEGFWKIVAEGRAILRFQAIQVDRACLGARPCDLDGIRGVAVNSGLFQSEIGHKLLADYPEAQFAAIWFEDSDGSWKFSLRGRKGGVDVSELARKHGGGGHAAAAGYEVKPDLTTEEAPKVSDQVAA